MVRPWYWPKGGQPHRTEEFTWIVKDVLAVSWWPDPSVFDRYRKEGVSIIINCSEFDYRHNLPPGFKYYYISVPDYALPSEEQIDKFLKITKNHTKNKEAIVVHCVAGCGRTGQFVVAWAAYNRYLPKAMDPVKWIRSLRPCSLETEEQMIFARNMAKKYGMNR